MTRGHLRVVGEPGRPVLVHSQDAPRPAPIMTSIGIDGEGIAALQGLTTEDLTGRLDDDIADGSAVLRIAPRGYPKDVSEDLYKGEG